jgi:dihydroorotase
MIKKMVFRLPKWIVLIHGHPRDMRQAYKMTLFQYILECYASFIRCIGCMPNTDPTIADLQTLEIYLDLIKKAMKDLGLTHEDIKIYIWFGASDYNLDACESALDYPEVVGIKLYAHGVTTGNIGVEHDDTIAGILEISAKKDKPTAVHCDELKIIKKYGYIKEAESSYVQKVVDIGRKIPGAKIYFCHLSCRESVEIVDRAIAEGLNALIEICVQYLWFTKEGHNWNKFMDFAVNYVFNNIRGLADRTFLRDFISAPNSPVTVSGDSAPHAFWEKVTRYWLKNFKKIGGMATHQHVVTVMLTLAIELGLSEQIISDLLYGNANAFWN